MEAIGLTDDFCTDCEAVYGGEQILTNRCLLYGDAGSGGDYCSWESPDGIMSSCIPGCGDCPHWLLSVGGVTVTLDCDGAGMATYEVPIASFDCGGPSVLSKTSATLHCINWPATITIEPV